MNFPDLHTISIDFKFCPVPDASGSASTAFISKLTELVALKRISHSNATISWAFQSETDDRGEDDGIGSEGDSEDESEDDSED